MKKIMMLKNMPTISIDEGKGLEEKIVQHLVKSGLDITTAESCTGGLLSATLVNVSGASEILNQAVVTYSNQAKRKILGVKKSTLKKHGAVSKQTAYEMAMGAKKFAKSKVAISTTGIAGPDGGTKKKPVGLVYVGVYVNGTTYIKKFLFQGSRDEVRRLTVVNALNILWQVVFIGR